MTVTKESFRKECLYKLAHTSKFNKIYRDNLVNRHLQRVFYGKKNLNVLCYFPLDLEVDIRKTITELRKKNNVVLPFMEEISFKMVPFRLPLSRKKFNIYEAGNSHKNIRKIDVAIIPAVGVDRQLRRIGFGKGMYDRFFEKLKSDPYKIFLQSQICYTNHDIGDAHDIACDMLITPRQKWLHRRKRDADNRFVRGFNSHNKRCSRLFHF